MSIYKKLNEARLALQNTKLNKSGNNKFAGYKYFELADFLPAINSIMANVGLCGVVSFTSELATLTLTDIYDGSSLVITSPMGSANLKGCHEVQNIGAVETYQRRYLWVSALEIVEHDALEATTGKDEKPAILKTPLAGALDNFSEEEVTFLRDQSVEFVAFTSSNDFNSAHELWAKLDNEEKTGLWSMLDSKTRSSFKKYQDSLKQKEAA